MSGPYLCPACRSPVQRQAESWDCAACAKVYPVLFGIADFRLAPDPYLSLADERAKAARLHGFAQDHSFAETVAEYYRITDDVPPAMARRFAAYVHAGVARGQGVLDRMAGPELAAGPLLDAGCGAGGLVLAAARAGQDVTGLDIALRWLVIARKRLDEAGVQAELVCADIAAPPFAAGQFSRITALDLFEHLPDPPGTAQRLHALLRPGGRLFATGANRYTLAPYPLAGLWGVGFLPAPLRRRYVIWRRGFDTLRHARLLSPYGLAGLLRRAGFGSITLRALDIGPDQSQTDQIQTGSRLKKFILQLYRLLRTVPVIRGLMVLTGPAFESQGQKLFVPPGASHSDQG